MSNDRSSLLDRIDKKTLERLLTAGTATVVVLGACLFALGRPPRNSVDLFIALNGDGSFEAQMHTSFVWTGPTPLLESTFGGDVALVEDRWSDGAGRPLDVVTEQREGGGYVQRVRFAEPVFPNERMELKQASRTVESFVRREGKDHVFQTNPNWCGSPTALTYTVTLPKGADVVSTQPKAKWDCVVGGRKVLHFKWTERAGHHPELQVRYSLPQA